MFFSQGRTPNNLKFNINGKQLEIVDEFNYLGVLLRDGPFNFQGGYGFFLKKYSDSQCCWKKYSDFGGGKTK